MRLFHIPVGLYPQITLILIAPLAYAIYVEMNPSTYEKDNSVPVAKLQQFSSTPQTIRLRPSQQNIIVPANHIRFVHSWHKKNRWPELSKSDYVMFDQVDLAFQFPDFKPIDAQNQKSVYALRNAADPGFLQIKVNVTGSGDGNAYAGWDYVLKRIKQYGKKQNPSLYTVEDHGIDTQTGLHAYKVGNSMKYIKDTLLIQCSLRIIKGTTPCGASYRLLNGVTVTFHFSSEHLVIWKDIDNFVRENIRAYGLPPPTYKIPLPDLSS
jgi:hypothetical protein